MLRLRLLLGFLTSSLKVSIRFSVASSSTGETKEGNKEGFIYKNGIVKKFCLQIHIQTISRRYSMIKKNIWYYRIVTVTYKRFEYNDEMVVSEISLTLRIMKYDLKYPY